MTLYRYPLNWPGDDAGKPYPESVQRALSRRDRCDGSLQLTMSPQTSECPVCGTPVPVVDLDGQPVLVEHRPRRGADALPIGLGL